jgi:hypothetical protein
MWSISECCGCCRIWPAKRTQPPKTSGSPDDGAPVIPSLPLELIRCKSELRILQPVLSSKSQDGGGSPLSCSARSLFEASALRVQRNQQGAGGGMQVDIEDHGIPKRFLEAYIAAITNGNIR